jgi:hypothetical protein
MGVMGRGRRDKRNGLTGMRDHLHMSTSAIALEPRFMFDAAGVATAADAVVHDPAADALFDTADHSMDQALLDAAAQAPQPIAPAESASQPVADDLGTAQPSADMTVPSLPESAGNDRLEVVFIDSNLADYQALVSAVRPGVEVVVLDAKRSGISQVAEWAQTHSGYDAIHVFSHGLTGNLKLGSEVLTPSTIDAERSELALIGTALKQDGDILLYACDTASTDDGQAGTAEEPVGSDRRGCCGVHRYDRQHGFWRQLGS